MDAPDTLLANAGLYRQIVDDNVDVDAIVDVTGNRTTTTRTDTLNNTTPVDRDHRTWDMRRTWATRSALTATCNRDSRQAIVNYRLTKSRSRELPTGGGHVNRPHIRINAGRSQLTVTALVDIKNCFLRKAID